LVTCSKTRELAPEFFIIFKELKPNDIKYTPELQQALAEVNPEKTLPEVADQKPSAKQQRENELKNKQASEESPEIKKIDYFASKAGLLLDYVELDGKGNATIEVFPNLYNLLGVGPTAGLEKIRSRFRELQQLFDINNIHQSYERIYGKELDLYELEAFTTKIQCIFNRLNKEFNKVVSKFNLEKPLPKVADQKLPPKASESPREKQIEENKSRAPAICIEGNFSDSKESKDKKSPEKSPPVEMKDNKVPENSPLTPQENMPKDLKKHVQYLLSLLWVNQELLATLAQDQKDASNRHNPKTILGDYRLQSALDETNFPKDPSEILGIKGLELNPDEIKKIVHRLKANCHVDKAPRIYRDINGNEADKDQLRALELKINWISNKLDEAFEKLVPEKCEYKEMTRKEKLINSIKLGNFSDYISAVDNIVITGVKLVTKSTNLNLLQYALVYYHRQDGDSDKEGKREIVNHIFEEFIRDNGPIEYTPQLFLALDDNNLKLAYNNFAKESWFQFESRFQQDQKITDAKNRARNLGLLREEVPVSSPEKLVPEKCEYKEMSMTRKEKLINSIKLGNFLDYISAVDNVVITSVKLLIKGADLNLLQYALAYYHHQDGDSDKEGKRKIVNHIFEEFIRDNELIEYTPKLFLALDDNNLKLAYNNFAKESWFQFESRSQQDQKITDAKNRARNLGLLREEVPVSFPSSPTANRVFDLVRSVREMVGEYVRDIDPSDISMDYECFCTYITKSGFDVDKPEFRKSPTGKKVYNERRVDILQIAAIACFDRPDHHRKKIVENLFLQLKSDGREIKYCLELVSVLPKELVAQYRSEINQFFNELHSNLDQRLVLDVPLNKILAIIQDIKIQGKDIGIDRFKDIAISITEMQEGRCRARIFS
jgi:hypothetical protein